MNHNENALTHNQLIIFDWDGTLIDSHHYIIDSMLLAADSLRLNLPSREQVSSIIGMSMAPAIQVLFPNLNEQQVLEFRGIYTEYYNDKNRKQPVLFEGVFESLHQLKEQGYLLAIATGKRRPGLLRGLEETQTGHFFSELRTADDCKSKPNPDMVNSILSSMKIKAHHSVVVGDNVLDIQMANAASVKAIGVTTGSSSEQALLHAGASYCFHDFRKLLPLF